MDAAKPLLPNRGMMEEDEELASLWRECEAFLQKWKAHKGGHSDRPTDAFVAILELQVHIVARRAYILASLTQEKLPF